MGTGARAVGALGVAVVIAACDSLGGLSSGDEPAPADASTASDATGDGGPTPGNDASDDAAIPGAAYRAEVLADSPLAYYRFEDGPGAKTAKDETGAHDGAYPIDPSFIESGIAGSHALHIVDGSLSHVRVPGAAFGFPDRATMAVETWVRASTYVDYEMLVSNEPAAAPRRGWSLYLRTPGRAELDWFEGPPATTDSLAKFGATFIPDGGTGLSTGAWMHLVFEYDGTGTRLYVDGTLAHNESSSKPSADPASDLLIGCRATTSGVRDCLSDGDLDEVAIYDHVLGDIRVKAHYTKGKP